MLLSERGCRVAYLGRWLRWVCGFCWGDVSVCLSVCLFVCLSVRLGGSLAADPPFAWERSKWEPSDPPWRPTPSDPPQRRLWDQSSNMGSFCVFTFLGYKYFQLYPSKSNCREVLGVQGSRAHQDASFEHHAGSVGPSNVWVVSFLRKEASQYFWCTPIIFRPYSRIFLDQNLERVSAQLLCF